MLLNSDFLDRLNKINWFSNCGQDNISKQCQLITSKTECVDYFEAPGWEELTLEASNKLSEYLDANYNTEYQEWNEFADAGRQFIKQKLEPKFIIFKENNSFSDVFVDCVKWDILHIIIYFQYNDLFKDAFPFYSEIFNFYETGHFPCGWVGDEWPNGKFVVF